MPRSRNTKLFVNGKPVRKLDKRVISGTLPRKVPAPTVENRIVLSVGKGVDIDATSLTGGALRLISNKKGKEIFRKHLREGTVTFAKDDADVLAVYKTLGGAKKGEKFSTQLAKKR